MEKCSLSKSLLKFKKHPIKLGGKLAVWGVYFNILSMIYNI